MHARSRGTPGSRTVLDMGSGRLFAPTASAVGASSCPRPAGQWGMTNELIDFLRARLDEDEQIARGHQQASARWHHDGSAHEVRDDENAGTVAFTPQQGDGDHIARHDPARVLAEVEARRQTVERCVTVQAGVRDDFTADWLADDVLALLALPYADHPDYREEWRP